MKLRNVVELLGLRQSPVAYGYEVESFRLPVDGEVELAYWTHPKVGPSSFDQSAVDSLRSFLRPGDVAVDVGAFSGDTAVPMALAVGAEGCVFAVEPNPFVFPTLLKNATLNAGKTRIVPLMFAAAPEDGILEFEYSDPGFCNGGRHEGVSAWRHGHAFKLRVQARNLERHLRAHYKALLPRLRFVKVDAEGFDFVVLRSIESLLREFRPYLLFEVFKRTSRPQREQLFSFVEGLGYRSFVWAGDARRRDNVVTRDNLVAREHFDAFCVPSPEP